MKIWECTHDLIDCLSTDSTVSLYGSRVLELGCGMGLPGILALMSGAECVHFQDYNREVLNCMTIPSVLASVKLGRLIANNREVDIVDTICVLVSSGRGVNGGHGGKGDGEHV